MFVFMGSFYIKKIKKVKKCIKRVKNNQNIPNSVETNGSKYYAPVGIYHSSFLVAYLGADMSNASMNVYWAAEVPHAWPGMVRRAVSALARGAGPRYPTPGLAR